MGKRRRKSKSNQPISHGRLQGSVDQIKRADNLPFNQDRYEWNYHQRLCVMEKMRAIHELEVRPQIDLGGGEVFKAAFRYNMPKFGNQVAIVAFAARHRNEEKRKDLVSKVKQRYGVEVQFV